MWTFYNANGQRLSSAATNISVLDIDGATDIGADIVDADLFIIDDGAGGTNRKTAASRIKTYAGTTQAVASDIVAGTNEDTYIPPDLMKHHPGVAKVLLSSAADQSTLSLYGCSVAYSSTSTKTVSYTVAFAATTYTMVLGLTLTSNASGVDTHSPSTSQCIFRGTRHDNGAAEASINHLAIFGAQ
jgi:hypothetical protein